MWHYLCFFFLPKELELKTTIEKFCLHLLFIIVAACTCIWVRNHFFVSGAMTSLYEEITGLLRFLCGWWQGLGLGVALALVGALEVSEISLWSLSLYNKLLKWSWGDLFCMGYVELKCSSSVPVELRGCAPMFAGTPLQTLGLGAGKLSLLHFPDFILNQTLHQYQL